MWWWRVARGVWRVACGVWRVVRGDGDGGAAVARGGGGGRGSGWRGWVKPCGWMVHGCVCGGGGVGGVGVREVGRYDGAMVGGLVWVG